MTVKEFVELITDQRLPSFTKGGYGLITQKGRFQLGGRFFLSQVLYVVNPNRKIVITNRSF